MIKKGFIWGFFVICVAGCGTPPIYKDIFNQEASYNSKEFSVASDSLYDAAIRTICSKNFIIEKEDKAQGFILAKRSVQKGRKTTVLVLQARISLSKDNKSMLYLSALQTSEKFFISDRTRFFLFIIPLPGGGGKEATTIKEGETVVDDKVFYQKFFAAIERELK